VTKARDFVGPYRLARLIRAGHACMVWEAVNAKTGERFALKMLRAERGDDSEEIGYLKHEWEVTKNLNHPNIIRVYDLPTQFGPPFLVMELYSALNLKLVLREGPEPLAWIAEKIIHQVCHALHYLHEKGWVHCDMKPDNVLVDDDGNVKVIDFTIAQKPKRDFLSFLKPKGPVRGTRSYMSPEQIRGETLDGRSDVYSLGCVFFELLSGRPPYTGSTPNELLERHLKSSVPSVVVYNKEVSRECADLIRRMMSKKRETRPNSMWDTLQEFKNVRIFNKKPTPPKVKLSELEVGPITDAEALKMSQASKEKDKQE
jgi:serine/threonine protein kinase